MSKIIDATKGSVIVTNEICIEDTHTILRHEGTWQISNAWPLPHTVYCSVCHAKFAQTHWRIWKDGSLPRNFCPNCGADMREKDERQF